MVHASLALLLVGVLAAEACYLQNCPLFGKRNPRPRSLDARPMRECGACGVSGEGVCVGEATCCSDAGCVMGVGLEATIPCRLEALRSEPCRPKGSECKQRGGAVGSCAAYGLCCSNDACEASAECRKEE